MIIERAQRRIAPANGWKSRHGRSQSHGNEGHLQYFLVLSQMFYHDRLCGLTRDELRYILDPKDVYGPDIPGETFCVLKEKDEKQYGEYRTRRLVSGAWDKLETY